MISQSLLPDTRAPYESPDCVSITLSSETVLCLSNTGDPYDDPDDQSGDFNWS